MIAERTHGRVAPRTGYAILVAIGLVLTWMMSVFEIISYASRAFALYHALQALIAAHGVSLERQSGAKAVAFTLLGLMGVLIAVFGTSV